ncbi:MAG: flagellar basal body P-ring formation chaperone FlgA [Gammaproteobacteria bacterium]|nr:flagellar basal body P-ring formation chaperone FlgA [Gammaproteobacteria bacterium]
MRLFYFLLMLSMIGTSAASTAKQYHSHDDIRSTVNDFLQNSLQLSKGIELKTTVSHLDPRLKLTRCDIPLSAFVSSDMNQNAKFSVGVKCTDQKPWSLYVSVNVEKFTNLYVASSPLSRGEAITEDNIQQVKRDINKLRSGFYTNKDELIGMVAKRSIRAGTIFSNKHITPPMIIKRGDNVDIVAKTSSILIRMPGKAMTDGAKGQRIRVKNNSSRRIINAIVVTPGLVKVRM